MCQAVVGNAVTATETQGRERGKTRQVGQGQVRKSILEFNSVCVCGGVFFSECVLVSAIISDQAVAVDDSQGVKLQTQQ